MILFIYLLPGDLLLHINMQSRSPQPPWLGWHFNRAFRPLPLRQLLKGHGTLQRGPMLVSLSGHELVSFIYPSQGTCTADPHNLPGHAPIYQGFRNFPPVGQGACVFKTQQSSFHSQYGGRGRSYRAVSLLIYFRILHFWEKSGNSNPFIKIKKTLIQEKTFEPQKEDYPFVPHVPLTKMPSPILIIMKLEGEI